MKKLFFTLIAAIIGTIGANAQYKIGDICTLGNTSCLVVDVDASGQHGLVLSLTECKKDWLADMSLEMETNAFFEDDGMKNMEAIAKYIASHNLSWDKFPIFAWARSLGEGWYIPSRNELNTIWKNLNGGNLDLNKKASKLWKNHEKNVQRYGGDTFFCRNESTAGVWKMLTGMISSTESEGGEVWAINTESNGMNLFNPIAAPNVKIIEYVIKKNAHSQKGDKAISHRRLMFRARAVHKF